jgi:hypothetical protein
VSTLSEPVGGREVSGREWENEDGAADVERGGFDDAGVVVGDG